MSVTTALNISKKSLGNKRIVNFYRNHYDRGVHSLECLSLVNETYFTHVIAKVEGKTKV